MRFGGSEICRARIVFSTKGREGTGATPFLSAKGREGARRKPFFTKDLEGVRSKPFSTKGREEHLLSAKGREGARRTPFIREGPRRGAKNTFYPRRAAKGREEHLYPRRAAKEREEPFIREVAKEREEHLLSAKGREGARRNTLNPFYARRAALALYRCTSSGSFVRSVMDTTGLQRRWRMAAARVLEGALRGIPPHKGGRLRPTARNCSDQWSVISDWVIGWGWL